YLGELWVLIEFENAKVNDLFKENGGANSWFSVLNQVSEDFTLGWRIAWVEVEEEEEEDDVSVEDNHGWIHSDQEINNCNDVNDVKEVPETCFNVPEGNLNEGRLDGGCAKKVNEEVAGDDNSFVHTVGGKENFGSVNKMSYSMGSCRVKKSGMPRTGGSILSFMEEVVKVGQTIGYNMDGCVKDITEIIKSQEEFGVHR
nr:nucleotide-binding alpha-beta plait domain-containing protein [Tanacetum cinerariifolium]